MRGKVKEKRCSMNFLSDLIHAVRSFKHAASVVTTTTSVVDIWLQRLEEVPHWTSSTKYPPRVVRTPAGSIKQKNFWDRSLKEMFFFSFPCLFWQQLLCQRFQSLTRWCSSVSSVVNVCPGCKLEYLQESFRSMGRQFYTQPLRTFPAAVWLK